MLRPCVFIFLCLSARVLAKPFGDDEKIKANSNMHKLSKTSNVFFKNEQSSGSAYSRKAGKPLGSPSNIKITSLSTDSIQITWKKMPTEFHRGPGFKYIVSYRPNVGWIGWTDITINDWKQESYTFTGLHPDSFYFIKIEAANDQGVSDTTPIVDYAYTLGGEAKKNPTITEVSSPSTGVMKIKWEILKSKWTLGPYFRYVISYKPDVSGTSWKEKIIDSLTQDEVSIAGLIPRKNYRVKMVAVNNYGVCPAPPDVHSVLIA